MSKHRIEARLVRWRLKIAENEYGVVYKAEKINVNADELSRNPVSILLLGISKILEHHYLPFPLSVSVVEKTKLRAISTAEELGMMIL
jgi:hypothetical protein